MADNNESICTICLGRLQPLQGLPNGCEHRFDVQCIRTWTRDHTTCPTCRAPYSGLRIGTRNGPFDLEEVPRRQLPEHIRTFLEPVVAYVLSGPHVRRLEIQRRLEGMRHDDPRHLEELREAVAYLAVRGAQLPQPTPIEDEQEQEPDNNDNLAAERRDP